MKAKRFCLGDVLSITTGRLVSPRHMDGVYDILNYMTGDNLFTHQIPRASRACKPVLLAQFPQLAAVGATAVTPENFRVWIDDQIVKYGNSFDVRPLDGDNYGSKDPIQEAYELMGPDHVIVVDQDS